MNMNQQEHGRAILSITHAVICGRSLEEAERAFGVLCRTDLEAAIHLADILVLASPTSAPIWTAIMEHMAMHKEGSEHPTPARGHVASFDDGFCCCNVGTGGHCSTCHEKSGPAMSVDDTRDTADDLAAHMGWLDVETGGNTRDKAGDEGGKA